MYIEYFNISLFYVIQGDHLPMILAGLALALSVIGILFTACTVGILRCWLHRKFRQIQQGRQQLQPDQNAPNDGGEN